MSQSKLRYKEGDGEDTETQEMMLISSLPAFQMMFLRSTCIWDW